MHRTAPKHSKKPPPAWEHEHSEGIWRVLTQAAFFLALVLVIARATIPEAVRDEVLPMPGTSGAPSTPGPATGLVLDLLCCVPALLVLARRAVNPRFVLRLTWSHLPMFLLAGWTLLSVLWSGNKFVALVAASHWTAALVLLWAASQLVDSWPRIRLVAAAGFGILLVLLVQGYYYRFVDLPDFQQNWRQNRLKLLQERGTDPNSVEATQLGKNIESGEVTGFSLSRNTYAALLVLLGILAAGIAIQRIAWRDRIGWVAPVLIALGLTLPMLYLWVQSKTAYATPFIGAILLAATGWQRQWIARNSRRIFWAGVGALILAITAVVGHGLRHGTLFQQSLTVRWQYWVGAARLFVHHPWLGVGWANFGPYYLMYRLPQAVEQPKDPHNFLVRAFVELGIVGGILTIAWMLRLWWELTQYPMPATQPAEREAPSPRAAVLLLTSIATIAILINTLASVDFTQSSSWVFLELFKRALFLLALVVGICVAAIRSMDRQALDDRPAPWILYALLVGLGLFLVHNLIDFSMFEPGPMCLFALLAGAALGMRLPERAEPRSGRGIALPALVLGAIAWLAAGAGVLNVALAESLAQDADNQVRNRDPAGALQKLMEASRLVPINADYDYRASLLAGGNLPLARQLLEKAIATDPSQARYHRTLAEVDLNAGDIPNALGEYQQAIERDPNDLDLRIEYADALRKYARNPEARREYEKVLELNSKLPPTEIRRLPEDRVNQIRSILSSLPRG